MSRNLRDRYRSLLIWTGITYLRVGLYISMFIVSAFTALLMIDNFEGCGYHAAMMACVGCLYLVGYAIIPGDDHRAAGGQ